MRRTLTCLRRLRLAVAICAVGAGPLVVQGAGPWQIGGSADLNGDAFGSNCRIDGDTLIVGAPRDETLGTFTGAAYIYRWTGDSWAEEATLFPSVGANSRYFGSFVDVCGDTAVVVGRRLSIGNVVDIFVRTDLGWALQDTILENYQNPCCDYWRGVDISGDTIVIGKSGDSGMGEDAGVVYVFARQGETWSQQTELYASDAAPSDTFGTSVAIEGDTLVVAAPGEDDGGDGAGVLYVFERTGDSWTETSKILAADHLTGDRLGLTGVSISGDTIAASAFVDNVHTGPQAQYGSVCVFRRVGAMWVEEARLAAPAAQEDEYTGQYPALYDDTLAVITRVHNDSSVYVYSRNGASWTPTAHLLSPLDKQGEYMTTLALHDRFLAMGAPYTGWTNGPAGRLYLFERTNGQWADYSAKSLTPTGAAVDTFGYDVGLSGDVAIAGIPLDDGLGTNAGAARVLLMEHFAWSHDAILRASDGADFDNFGFSVDVSGGTALVGAHLSNAKGSDSGSAYVFTGAGALWSQEDKLVAPDGAAGDWFGFAVSIDGDTALVGAPMDDDAGSASGAAYVFTRTGGVWSMQQKLAASDGGAGDQFGASVVVQGDTAVVGAPFEDAGGMDAGAAYTFVRSGGVWTQQAKLTTSDASGGDKFGVSVALDGEAAVIGARRGDGLGSDASGAYAFARDGSMWEEQSLLLIDRDGAIIETDIRVALSGDKALVSAFEASGSVSGSVWIFRRVDDSWLRQGVIRPADGIKDDRFGVAVAMSGEDCIIGADRDDEAGANRGAVWFSDVTEARLSGYVKNLSSGELNLSLPDAVGSAGPTDDLFVSEQAFSASGSFDFQGKSLSIVSGGDVRQPHQSTITMADGATLASAPGAGMILYGSLVVPSAVDATLQAGAIRQAAVGSLTTESGASLTLATASPSLGGTVEVMAGSIIDVVGAASVDGVLTLSGGAIQAPALTVERGGAVTGEGDVLASVIDRGAFTALGDMLVTGDFSIEAPGALTVLGSAGRAIGAGDVPDARSATGVMIVGGTFNADAASSVALTGGALAIHEDSCVAIDDHDRFDMVTGEVRMVGASGAQSFERMSRDIGHLSYGLDPTRPRQYPIGTLRVGPAGTTVNLVDTYDNDGLGQGVCEAVYVSTLIIEEGATLNTNGCPVYYETLLNNGSVDDPSNLIPIVDCTADIIEDGVINGADLAALLASWGTANAASDLNGDGNVDGSDLAALLASWGAC